MSPTPAARNNSVRADYAPNGIDEAEVTLDLTTSVAYLLTPWQY